MPEDVEIIEDCKQIIEISDDDSVTVDFSPDLILISNVEEGSNESGAEFVDIQEETPELITRIDNNFSLQKTIPVQTSICQSTEITTNTTNPFISSVNNITKPVDKKVSNVSSTKKSQINEVIKHNTCSQISSLVNKTAESINNLHSNLTKSACSQPNIGVCKRRKRNRGKKKKNKARNKLIENCLNSQISINLKKSAVVQTEPNFPFNNSVQNENTTVDIPERAACSLTVTSPTSITKKPSDYHDFSKLKWLKPLKNLSSPPDLQIVIIDRSHPDWIITNDKWLMIEKRLLESLNNEMLRTNDASIGLFDGAKWQRGIKIVGCQNEHAFNYVMQFIINLDKLWHGADLDAFPISLVTRHEVKVYIPPPILKTELIMSLIKLQNPSICSNDWKVIRERERPYSGGVDIWISINDESFTQLCRLGGEVKYGINRIWINPCRQF